MWNKKIIFIIPNPKQFLSGGNLYNAALLKALQKEGLDIQHIELEKWAKKPSFDTKNTLLFWDTLYLDALDILHPSHNNGLIVHHLESLYPPKGWTAEGWFEAKERKKLEKFKYFLVSSFFTQTYLISKGFAEKTIIVIPPALVASPVITVRKYDKVHALMVANLQERKGIYPFLKALAAKGKNQDFKLTIIGNAKMEEEYAQKCLNLIQQHPFLQQRVHFKGILPPQAVAKMYQQSNLYISTAFMETFGMSMQEAAASGMPLLVFDGGNAVFHVKNGKNGITFENIDHLADSFLLLTEDKTPLKEMGEAAFDLATKDTYNWSIAAQHFLTKLQGK